MASTTEIISTAQDTIETHNRLMEGVRNGHAQRRRILASLPSSATADIRFPDEPPERSPSPEVTPSYTTEFNPHRERQLAQLARTDLSPEKLAKVKRYQNYIPEEETIRNDYSQQYVDSGEWPQNWVLGAELEKRFEE